MDKSFAESKSFAAVCDLDKNETLGELILDKERGCRAVLLFTGPQISKTLSDPQKGNETQN